ncbi:MAG: hypothetical protein U0359_20340 [Byssovorax sp.]
MSNDDLNGDDKLVNDLIDAIKFRLEFLERALRDSDRRVPSWTDTNLNSDDDEGSTSTVFDQKMSDVLSRDNWDTYLVKIVRKFVHIRAKRESTKSSFEDPALIDAITTSLRSKAKQTLLRNNITQDVRAGDRENQEQTKKTLRAQARADAFIGQHVTYFFVQRTLADDTSTVEESLADWRAWAPREIVSFYDAAIAEILAGRRVVGALSAFYFDQSLKAARDVHFADYTRLAQYSNFTVPARKEITTALLASSADNRDALLHGLLPDAHLVAHVIRDLLLKNRIVEIARWINGLISPCKSKSNEGQKRVLGLSDTRPKEKPRQARPTTGRSTHIFDPDRILKVTAAATEISASTDSNLADSDNARIISDAKRDFILACVLVSAGQQPDPKPKLAPARSEDNWKLLSDLETIWWNSFDSTSQSPPWNATKIIEFCSGKTAAQWQKSHSGATRSRIRNAFAQDIVI